jgi:hypothetical protein
MVYVFHDDCRQSKENPYPMVDVWQISGIAERFLKSSQWEGN